MRRRSAKRGPVAGPGAGHAPADGSPETTLRAKVSGGVPWSLGGYIASRVITLATTIVLARLLAPADFGLFALAMLALTVINVLSDGGLTGVLLVRQDLDRRAQGTVLTVLLGMGALFGLLLVAIAPLAAELFREPRLAAVMRALGVISLLSGAYWFYGVLLQRELAFRKRFVVQMCRTIAYAATAIVMAALGAGVWSLVGGQLAGAVVVTAVLPWISPYRVVPSFDAGVARLALRDGRGFLLQAVVTTVQDNIDFAVVGRILGAAPLGVYSMAYRLAEVPYASIADPIARVSFPAFAKMRHAGRDVASGFLRELQLVALLTWPLGVILSGAAEPFTRAILGERWLGIIGPLGVFGIWAAIRPLETTVGWFLNAMGQAGRSGRISAALLVPLPVALVVGAHAGGVTGVGWVLLAHLALTVGLLARVAHRRLAVPASRQWRALRPLVVPAAVCWVVTRVVATAADTMPAAPALALAVVAGALTFLALVRLIDPPLLRATLAEARRALKGAATAS